MLIATLGRIRMPTGNIVYYAADPFDGEILTGYHATITQVDDDLQDGDKQWGLNTAAYAGESDVPLRVSEDGTEVSIGSLVPRDGSPFYSN